MNIQTIMQIKGLDSAEDVVMLFPELLADD